MRYEEVAHIKKSATGNHYLFQSNEEHLEGVAKLAEQFASEFGMGSWGYVLGLLHDKGKERKSFQDYIKPKSVIRIKTYHFLMTAIRKTVPYMPDS